MRTDGSVILACYARGFLVVTFLCSLSPVPPGTGEEFALLAPYFAALCVLAGYAFRLIGIKSAGPFELAD